MSNPQQEYGELYTVYGTVFQTYSETVSGDECYIQLISSPDGLVFGLFGIVGEFPYLIDDDYVVGRGQYFYSTYTYESTGNGIKTIPLFFYYETKTSISIVS